MLAAMGAKLSTDRDTGRPRVDCVFESHGKAVNMRVAAMVVEETSDEDSVMSNTTGVWRLAGLTSRPAADEGTGRYPDQCSDSSCIEGSIDAKTAVNCEKNENIVCIVNILFLLIMGVCMTEESIYRPIMHMDSNSVSRVCHYTVVSDLPCAFSNMSIFMPLCDKNPPRGDFVIETLQSGRVLKIAGLTNTPKGYDKVNTRPIEPEMEPVVRQKGLLPGEPSSKL